MSAIYKNGRYYGVGGGGGGADTQIIAKDFDPTESYDIGKYVMQEGDLYKCTTAHTGEWDESDFDSTQVMDEIPTPMPSTDMSEVVTPLPGVMSRRRIYSPDEQVIGEWREYVDGVLKKKPLYEKVFTGTFTGTSSTPVAIQTLPYYTNFIYGYGGAISTTSATGWCSVTISTVNPNTEYGDITLRAKQNYSSSSISNKYVVVIVYTKTTDEWEVI